MDVIKLSPEDNVAVLTRSIGVGDSIRFEDRIFNLGKALGLGHKIAIQPIAEGEKIVKYGAPIGSAKQTICVGEHVHLHNLQSDYLPTYTLDDQNTFHDAH